MCLHLAASELFTPDASGVIMLPNLRPVRPARFSRVYPGTQSQVAGGKRRDFGTAVLVAIDTVFIRNNGPALGKYV